MIAPLSVGNDHCRVTEPETSSDLATRFEYFRHLFPYAQIAERTARDARVLEVGCGAGYGANFLGATITGITATDTSSQAVEYARKKYPGIRFEQAQGTNLPFANALFDVVASFQVIEHVAEDSLYLSEIWRVLRPGGVLYLTTPNRRLRLLPYQPPWNPYHVREYSDRDLRALLRRSFPDTQLWGVMARPDLIAMERARVRQRPHLVLLRFAYQRLKPLLPRLLHWRPTPRDAKRSASRVAGPQGTVSLNDFFLSHNTRSCFDLFCIAHKSRS